MTTEVWDFSSANILIYKTLTNTFELLASSITWLWNDSVQGHKFDSLLFLLSCEWPFDAQMRGKLAMLEQALPLGITASISFHNSTHNAPLCVLWLWGETNKHDGQDQWTTSGRSKEMKITRATTMHAIFVSLALRCTVKHLKVTFGLTFPSQHLEQITELQKQDLTLCYCSTESLGAKMITWDFKLIFQYFNKTFASSKFSDVE